MNENTVVNPNNAAMQDRWRTVMMDNYGTPPLALAGGKGVVVTDVDGHEYLDFIAGIAVSALGHGHPAVVEAVASQVATLAHSSNLFLHEPGVRLSERLVELTGVPGARVFLANDGTESNECAIKISRLHGRTLDPSGQRLTIVSTNNSFHGRTLGSLSITGNPAKREPFEPLPGPVRFVDFGDVEQLRAAVDSSVAAVFLETTQGEGGVLPAPDGYLAAAREFCDATGALLVVDEVQSGIGRTGAWFSSLAAGVRPDILTLAKGLGGGMPIGACVGLSEAAASALTPGSHGSTFGGNPVSCAAALAVLDTIVADGLLANAHDRGEELAAGLAAIDSPLIHSVRGAGLWRGLVLTAPVAAALEAAARTRGLLVNAVRADVIRLAPPLVVTSAQVDEAVAIMAGALGDIAESGEATPAS